MNKKRARIKLSFRWTLFFILFFAAILRFWEIAENPISLYWDEQDIGYQSYSLLKTGRDYFGNFLPISPHSFADFRSPFYIYFTILTVGIFDLTALAVRLPAAIFGVLSVWITYLLVSEILEDKQSLPAQAGKKKGLLAAFLLTISPWHFQYSRMGFEVGVMLFFFLLGTYGFFKGLKEKRYLILSAIGLGLSLYSYSIAKLFVPMIVILLAILFRKELLKIERNFLLGVGAFFVIISIPLFYSNFFEGGGQRFSEITIFSDPTIGTDINNQRNKSALAHIQDDNLSGDVLGLETRLADKLSYNKVLSTVDKFTSNYYQTFSPNFLFLEGDPNLRHSPKGVGQFYRVEFLAFILGLVFLIGSLKNKKMVFLICWLLLAPLPAVVTREGGNHATRLFFLLPIVIILITLGIFYLAEISRKYKKLVLAGYFFVLIFSLGNFLNLYFGSYRLDSAKEFHYGFKEVIDSALQMSSKYDQVIIDGGKESVLMSYLFDSKMDPAKFQLTVENMNVEVAKRYQAAKIGNLYFLQPGAKDWWETFEKGEVPGKSIIITSTDSVNTTDPEKLKSKLKGNQNYLGLIDYPDSLPAFYIIENK